MREFDGKPGDRVTHKHYGHRATLVNSYSSSYGKTWVVRVADGGINFWRESNCIPESPVETLARALEEDHAV